jgi:hypothetical protein
MTTLVTKMNIINESKVLISFAAREKIKTHIIFKIAWIRQGVSVHGSGPQNHNAMFIKYKQAINL